MQDSSNIDQCFETMDLDKVRPDCRFYSGYKPCGKYHGCPDCPHFVERGVEILIIKLGAMGDVLRTKSLLPALKKKHPESWITWITNPGSEAIVRHAAVDEIQVMGVEGLLALEGRSFDELYCFDKEKSALALARQTPANRKYGYAPTQFNTLSVWNKGSEYALRMGLSDEFKYRLNRLSHPKILSLCAELPFERDEYSLDISPSIKASAKSELEAAGVNFGNRIVGLNTGCGPVFQTKAWTVEGFINAARELASKPGTQILLLGGKKEKKINARIHQACTSLGITNVIDSGHDNSLEEFFAIVDLCNVVVSSDSLAMHVAIALKKHVVAFFGPTCEQEIDLYDRGEKIITNYSCSPCYLKTCDVRPSCMQAMSHETVVSAVVRQLEALEKGGGVRAGE